MRPQGAEKYLVSRNTREADFERARTGSGYHAADVGGDLTWRLPDVGDRARPVASLESGFDYRCDMASVRLTEDMKRLVRDQRLGFVATVRLDGTPAVSPKGTTSGWDDAHLVFLHRRSPHTVANLEANPHVEVNVLDPIRRKGYRFAGTAEILTSGSRYEEIVAWFGRERCGDYRPGLRPLCSSL
jgi:general stress protein 26